MLSLESLGWIPFFAEQIDLDAEPDRTPVRVIEEQRGRYRVLGPDGEWPAEISGRLRHAAAADESKLPAVGDWVLAQVPSSPHGGVAIVHHVLARWSKFSRRMAGERTVEQVIAANVDTVFLVQSLNRNFNLRRLERYLALLWESGAQPVIVLSKADLCPDPEDQVSGAEAVAAGVPVHATSALVPGGLDALEPYLRPGQTVALVGSSGVGKSTIVNRLAGRDLIPVQEIRADDRGRHTTTARQLVMLPDGAMLLDTPGMRTVLMWEGEDGLARTFADVEALAAGCRFNDCTHTAEPGCAVREALERGTLDDARFSSYLKLQREVQHQKRRSDQRLRQAEQKRWRQIAIESRRRPDKRAYRA